MWKVKFLVIWVEAGGASLEKHYAEKFEASGFVRGSACAVMCYHPDRDLSCVVHGDDFTLCGLEEDLDWITKLIAGWFEIKVRGTLGPAPEDDKEIVILGRTVRWCDWGIEWEADKKHRNLLMERF